eukprot:5653119-Amphidinium_carterae.1
MLGECATICKGNTKPNVFWSKSFRHFALSTTETKQSMTIAANQREGALDDNACGIKTYDANTLTCDMKGAKR